MRRPAVFFLIAALLVPATGFSAGFGLPFGPRIARNWEELDEDERDRALKNYERYQRLPPEKRRVIDERYERWQGLPQSDKDQYRKKNRR